MDSFVLENVPFQIDTGQLYKNLRIKEGSELVAKLTPLVDKAQAIGRPKASYKVAFIESRGDDQIIIDGVMLTSRVLRVGSKSEMGFARRIGTYRLDIRSGSMRVKSNAERERTVLLMTEDEIPEAACVHEVAVCAESESRISREESLLQEEQGGKNGSLPGVVRANQHGQGADSEPSRILEAAEVLPTHLDRLPTIGPFGAIGATAVTAIART